MTPRLILLTGPAADDVAQVFWDGTPSGLPSVQPFWDEVRDYLAAPLAISDDFCGARTVTPEGIAAATHRAEGMAQAICSLPGGEEWLVGLVLPETVPYTRLPTRLAILAPEPPPLLVERVRAWGGEVWYCEYYQELESDNDRCCILVGGENNGYGCYFPTWPEAVRAALGEA